jgi:DNA-binding CsgD family transcriptional regulator
MDRALELIPEDFPALRLRLTGTGGEVFLASGQPHEALQWLNSRIVMPDAPRSATYNEDYLVDFARAAAEAARASRDAGDPEGVERVVATLDDMIAKWPRKPFMTPRPDVADHAMAMALFNAEVARCRGEAGQAELWREAVDKSEAAGWPWEATVSRLRCAEAMVAAGSPGSAVSDLLRHAHRTAAELGARPLQENIESLARLVRVPLRQPTPIVDTTTKGPAALAGLTVRELEVLAFLVAGRSNNEIAKDLFISRKTASVHVSNILRKTGTSSRVEVAALAERLTSISPLQLNRN